MNWSDLAKEIKFTTARSGGSGGQHVNKVETKVILHLDVDASRVLSIREKTLIKKNLQGFISKDGWLILTSESTRSQHRNKEKALTKLKALINKALAKRKKRIPTKPSAKAIEARKKQKNRRSEIKKMRKPPKPDSY